MIHYIPSILAQVVDLELISSDPKRVHFDSVTGEGVVYNVMLVGGGQNVYIPVATYACDLVGGACLSGGVCPTSVMEEESLC